MKPFILIVGPSGVGKTTLCNKLKEDLGLREVRSVTTRPRRPADSDEQYRFVTEDEFKAIAKVESVLYNGYHYGTPRQEVELSDILVAEPTGCLYIRAYCQHIHRPCYTIGLCAQRGTLAERMYARGDSVDKITERLANDSDTFRDFTGACDYVVNNFSMDACYTAIRAMVENWRKEA